MSNPLNRIQAAYSQLRDIAAKGLRLLLERLRAAWQRHLALMDDGDSYRAQVVAGVAAVVAAFELDPRAGALLVALFGLHAAAFGHRPDGVRARPCDDDRRWDPFDWGPASPTKG